MATAILLGDWESPDTPAPVESGSFVMRYPAPFHTLTVTCRHDQGLRDLLPAFAGQKERYVLWGEGTTDEMCLGIVLLTRP